MFKKKKKRYISDEVQKILKSTNHVELPDGEIKFHLHVYGKEDWSWADIKNNGDVKNPIPNPHNEEQANREG